MEHSQTIGELAKALVNLQGNLGIARKDAVNPFFNSKYADLATVWEVCRKPLQENGLAIIQVNDLVGENIVLETMLMHTSGEWVRGRLSIGPAKMDPQGIGSAITYARRYALSAMLGIVADEDDDGEAAMGRNDGKSSSNGNSEHWCPIHNCAFKKVSKDGQTWYSHRLQDGSYCNESKKNKEEILTDADFEPKPLVPGSDAWILKKMEELSISEDGMLEYINKTLHLPVEKSVEETLKKLGGKGEIKDSHRQSIAKAIEAKGKAATK